MVLPIIFLIICVVVYKTFEKPICKKKLSIDENIIFDSFVDNFIKKAFNEDYIYENIKIDGEDPFSSLLKIINKDRFYYSKNKQFFLHSGKYNIEINGYVYYPMNHEYILNKITGVINTMEDKYFIDNIQPMIPGGRNILEDPQILKKLKEYTDTCIKKKTVLYNYLAIKEAITNIKYTQQKTKKCFICIRNNLID